jgi:hypothetical protein
MRPAFIDDQSPPGEREMFHRLAEISGDWVVIHSLDVAPSNNNKRTEIDFLIIIPSLGLLCIEVKSQERIEFDGERWHPESIKRSPFRQAEDAKHALVRRFKKIRATDRLPFPIAKLCIFTNSAFDVQDNIGINPSELMDRRALAKLTSAEALKSQLETAMRSAIRNERLQQLSAPLSEDHIQQVLQECLPIQRRKASTRDELLAAEQSLIDRLREQQRPVLKLAELNPRLLVTGPAGTGKTLIAVELARKFSERGARVGVFCFNQLLGDWLEDELAGYPSVVAGRAIKTIAGMAGVAIHPQGDPVKYWEETLPNQILERITAPEFSIDYAFDVLLIDEAQDLLPRAGLWDCLLGILKGGGRTGRLVVFGDFSHQVVAGSAGLAARIKNFKETCHVVHWDLRENCRNLSCIGKAAVTLLDEESNVYEGYMRHSEDPRFMRYIRYESIEEQENIVRAEIDSLIAEGFAKKDIVLLSFCSEEKSVATRLRAKGQRLAPAGRASQNDIAFATINAFKGMERRAVIITDIDDLKELEHERHRLFVGATRATDRLRVLVSNQALEVIL